MEQSTGKIGYLVSQYPAVTHTFILREIRGLRALGFDVRVVSISSPDKGPEAMTAEEREEHAATDYIKSMGAARALVGHVRVLTANPIAYVRGLGYAMRLAGPDARRLLTYALYFAEAVLVARWARVQGVAHAHVHFSSTVALIASRVYPFSFSVTLHGPDEFTDPVGFRLAEKVAASRFICAISRFARSQIMKSSDPDDWSKIEIVPLGVDTAAPRGLRRSESSSPFDVVCVGRLAPVKAQRVLLAAIARLVDAGRDVRLTLVGDGPDRGALEDAARALGIGDVVRFTGPLNQDEVRSVYAWADAFALASFAEGVPVVLMEAMAAGVPCVATRITGIPELVRDGLDGLLVAPSDDEELAAALARLMDDGALRAALASSAKRRVVEGYDLATNVGRLAAAFERRLGPSLVERSREPRPAGPVAAAVE